MQTFPGVVRDGTIHLPANVRLRNGSRVVVAVLGAKARRGKPLQTPEMDAEDAAFVEACRPSINEAMRAEEAEFKRRHRRLGGRKGRKAGGGIPSETRRARKTP